MAVVGTTSHPNNPLLQPTGSLYPAGATPYLAETDKKTHQTAQQALNTAKDTFTKDKNKFKEQECAARKSLGLKTDDNQNKLKPHDDYDQELSEQIVAVATDVNATARNALGIPLALIKKMPKATLHAFSGTVAALQLIQCFLLVKYTIKSIPKTYNDLKVALSHTAASNRGEMIKTALLNHLNQHTLLLIGLVFAGLAVIGILALAGTTTAAALVAALAFNFILGIICILRGFLLIGRRFYICHHLNKLQKGLEKAFDSAKDINDTSSKEKDAAAINNAIAFLLENFDRVNSLLGKGIVGELGKLTETDWTDQDKLLTILENAHRTLFDKKLQQNIMAGIGALMVVGGVLSVLSTGSIIGSAAGIVSSVACGVFLTMEAAWVPVDSNKAFKWLSDKLYSEDEKFTRIRNTAADVNAADADPIPA